MTYQKCQQEQVEQSMYSMKIVKRKDYLMRNKNNRKIRQFNFQRQDRKVSLTKITKYVEDLYTAKTREFLGKAANENISKIARRGI